MLESLTGTPVIVASAIARALWLIPALPAAAAGVAALLKRPQRKMAAGLAIGSLTVSLALSLAALVHVLHLWMRGETVRETVNFMWMQAGSVSVDLGWALDPLSAAMLAMVSFVGLLIFVYSLGYMAHDENFTRFFCFLSLFAGAMLGVVIANSLLLLFMCWELVGLTSYLLIGFWYQRPAAAAAAKKAFLTTRVGDIFFFLGMVWLFAQSGTLLFYNHGAGSMEKSAIATLLAQPGAFGLSAATAIGLLIFCGAAGKSGQLPLHVWLPDAMEGPTPVSALIHAATMVAAGVYLVARVYPLLAAGMPAGGSTIALTAITWVGALTAVFAALIAVAQNDIKRILAYSTISQLGYMMAGVGMGGVAVGFFHLITHAFFKALLFLGAGSVIHGCGGEQDIRRMGGLKSDMPFTLTTYGVGMLALCGFPIFFSGYWSKDAILEAAAGWSVSRAPLYLLLAGALLTAFYMTRQIVYVFFGCWRGGKEAHESSAVMLWPLAILALFSIALGLFIGTPAWPAFRAFVENRPLHFEAVALVEPRLLLVMTLSAAIAVFGIGYAALIYRDRMRRPTDPDVLEEAAPRVWRVLRNRFYVDELYGTTIIAFYAWLARAADWLDRRLWGGLVALMANLFRLGAALGRFLDYQWVDGLFDKGCDELSLSGGLLARVQSGRAQTYLRLLALAVAVLAAILIWSSRG
jgi:NADH-quinone oxidoreductase subunit L